MPAPLIILTGPPGTGKSTAAERLSATFDRSALVGGDFFLEALRAGKIEPWLPASHDQNTRVMEITARTARDYATAGWTTVLEGIVGPWFLPTVLAEVGALEVHYLVLTAPLDVCRTRVRIRSRGSMSAIVEKMHAEFETHAPDDRHLVDADRPREEIVADLAARVASRDALVSEG
ncbi:MAG: AAA family ATPase [Acidimicrobiales bacterium]|nr:AAA family ATPase [Acidimicrobiales bacterium]